MKQKQAKDFVEKCPSVVKDNLSKEEADELMAKLTDIGCTITLK